MTTLFSGDIRVDAIAALRDVRSLIGSITSLTQEFEHHQRAIEGLGPALDAVAGATNGLVDEEDAWRASQRLTQEGITLTAQQLGDLTARARIFGRATGTETPDALERLTGALMSGSTRALLPFGIHLGHGQQRGDAFRIALAQIHDQVVHTTQPTASLAEQSEVLSRQYRDLQGTVAAAAAKFLDLGGAMREATTIFENLSNLDPSRINSLADLVGQITGRAGTDSARNRDNARASSQETLANAITSAARRGVDISTLGTRNERGRLGTSEAQRLAEFLNRGDVAGAAAMMHHQTTEHAAQIAATAAAATQAAATQRVQLAGLNQAGGAGGDSTAREQERLAGEGRKAALASEAQQAWDTSQAVIAAERAKNEARQAGLRQEQNILDERARMSMQERAMVAKNEAVVRDAAIGRDSLQGQMTERFRNHAELNQTTAQGMANLTEGAYNTMTSALKTHISAVIQGKEEIGPALKAMTQEILLNLATQAISQAIMELALGVASLARGIASYGADVGAVASAPMHFASAAMFGAIGAAAGLGYAGVSAIGGASSGAGAHSSAGAHVPPASAGTPSGGGSSGGVTNLTVNVNGFSMTHEGVQNTVVGAVEGYIGRGRVIRGLPRPTV